MWHHVSSRLHQHINKTPFNWRHDVVMLLVSSTGHKPFVTIKSQVPYLVSAWKHQMLMWMGLKLPLETRFTPDYKKLSHTDLFAWQETGEDWFTNSPLHRNNTTLTIRVLTPAFTLAPITKVHHIAKDSQIKLVWVIMPSATNNFQQWIINEISTLLHWLYRLVNETFWNSPEVRTFCLLAQIQQNYFKLTLHYVIKV